MSEPRTLIDEPGRLVVRLVDGVLQCERIVFEPHSGELQNENAQQPLADFTAVGPTREMLSCIADQIEVVARAVGADVAPWWICISPPVKELFKAIDDNVVRWVELAIEHGASPDAVDIRGVTALGHALMQRRRDAALALLRAGADPSLPSSNHNGMATPRQLAASQPELLAALVERGAK